MYKLQSIYPKQNQKQTVHESNKLCMLQIEKKATKKVKKKKKKSFINVTGDKLAMRIR